jgi:hypothetical protein
MSERRTVTDYRNVKCRSVASVPSGSKYKIGGLTDSNAISFTLPFKERKAVQEHFNAVRIGIMRCQDDKPEAPNICTVPGKDNSDYSHP